MMKKRYEQPVTEKIEVALQQMIAESIVIGDNYDGEAEIESRGTEWDWGVWNEDEE